MVKKLTISIPDDLHRKLDSYRDRIPISSVCANGLRAAIGEIEDCVSEARKRFYLLSFEEACEIAYKRGIHWAGYKASPEELAYACEQEISMDGTLYEKLVDANYKIRELGFDEHGMFNHFADYVVQEMLLEDILPPFMDELNTDIQVSNHFQRGAKVVWNEIKTELLPKLLNPED